MAIRSAEPGASTGSWPTSSSSVIAGRRLASGAVSPCRSWAASAKRSLMQESMLRSMSHEAAEDFSQPVLPGTARSDYERYLNTDELLALQKTPDEWVHRDEL